MHPRRLLLLLCFALATSLHGQDTTPIHDFLSSPIQSVRLNSGNSFYRQDTLRLTANKNGTLRANHALLTHFYRKAHYEEPYRIKCQRIRVQKNVRSRELYDILADIDRRPEQMPSIAEFNITSADKERFAKTVAMGERHHSQKVLRQKMVRQRTLLDAGGALSVVGKFENGIKSEICADEETRTPTPFGTRS